MLMTVSRLQERQVWKTAAPREEVQATELSTDLPGIDDAGKHTPDSDAKQAWQPVSEPLYDAESRIPRAAPHALACGAGPLRRSVRQRVGTHLDLEDLRIGLLAAFAVEVGARPRRGPDAAAFPARRCVVDPAIDILGEEAERIRHPQRDEFAVDQSQQRFAAIGGGDRHVGAEAQRIVAVDPDVIGMVGAALRIQSLELRTGQPIELPALRALLAVGRGRPVERSLAQLAVEARQLSAGENRPDHAVQS